MARRLLRNGLPDEAKAKRLRAARCDVRVPRRARTLLPEPPGSILCSSVGLRIAAKPAKRPSELCLGSTPVASFRGSGGVDRDQLELLRLRDLAKHYRRCTTQPLEGMQRSDTKSTRASEALPGPWNQEVVAGDESRGAE